MEEGEPSYNVGGKINCYNHMENIMEVPQKSKSKTNIQSGNPTVRHLSGENHNSKRYMHPNVNYSTLQ